MHRNDVSWTIDVVAQYGCTELVAEPTYLHEGEWLRSSWTTGSLRNPIRDLADFEVRMYLDTDLNFGAAPFGRRHLYRVDQLELAQAECALRVLRKLRRALDAVECEEGHLAQDDFAQYLFRIGKALGITRYRVRNTVRTRDTSGEYFALTDAAGVQAWVRDRVVDRGEPILHRV